MKIKEELQYYEEIKDWDFSKFEIETESLTNWDLYQTLNKLDCKEVLGTDYSKEMIKTANKNLQASNRKNISFRLMDNLAMDVEDNYYDIVVARNTVTDPKQIYKCLKKGGYLLIQGVDKDDCWSLKMIFQRGQGFHDQKSISIIDYENVLNASFKDVELIPIHKREYFKNKQVFLDFLKKVPIVDDFSEISEDHKDYYTDDLEEELIDSYIEKNTYNGRIRLLRRYYGIIARKY